MVVLEHTCWWKWHIDVLRGEFSESSDVLRSLPEIQVESEAVWCEWQTRHREYAGNSLEALPEKSIATDHLVQWAFICEPSLAQCCNINVVARQFGSYESSSSVRTVRVICIHQGSYIPSSNFDVSRFYWLLALSTAGRDALTVVVYRSGQQWNRQFLGHLF